MLLFIQKWALKVLIAVALLVGVGLYSYNAGINHEKGIETAKVIKVDNKITEKNNSLQATADKSASQVIVYKDRIITKYKTINQDAVQYAQTNQNASDQLDPDFISLHDRAASANGQDTITGSASESASGTKATPVTKADAIRVITDNYKRYYLCRNQVQGWIDFYSDLRTQVNGPDPKAQ